MTSTILIKNIYYMLTYAFTDLNHPLYRRMDGESFENIDDLFAAILVKGLSKQIKHGLFRDYIPHSEDLPTLRGKVDPKKTIQNRIQRKRLLHVEYDEMTEDNIYNRIPKSVALALIRNHGVKDETKNQLKRILLYFSEVSIVDLSQVPWSNLAFHRHNQSYELLINICYFLYRRLLMTPKSGSNRLPDYDEENLERLFEKFILNYYRKHHPELRPSSPQIKWALPNPVTTQGLLPTMKTDIVLAGSKMDLIIDTKFYKRMYQYNFETRKHRSNHLYQIFTYVQNQQANQDKPVAGLLLYAQAHNEEPLDSTYQLAGNNISIQSIDLNREFKEIQEVLELMIQDIK